jgi:hypothetical protein
MTGRFFGRLILAGAVSCLAGCGFHAPEPVRTPPPQAPVPPISTLTATVTLSADDVARRLNAASADHLADVRDQPVKCGFGRCRLTLHAVRTDPAEVRASGDALDLTLPFALRAELALPGSFSFMRAKADGHGLAQTHTTVGLGPDWSIQPRTTGTVELEDSHLRIGPLTTNIRDVWNDNDDLLSRPLFKMLDKQIAGAIHDQQKITQLWNRALTPIKIGKSPVAWLLLSPERIRVGQLATVNGAFVLSLGVEARARVVVQDVAPPVAPARLPPPAPLEGHDDRFAFTVPVTLPYDRAAALAMDSLTKKPPHVAGMTVRFTKLEILPSGEDVVLAAHFCADQDWDPFHWLSACGTGYLRGTPVFDPATTTVRILNVHYDIATEGVVLSAVRALAGPALGQDLEKRLVFRVGKDIDKLETQVTAALARPQGRDFAIAGDVQSFGPPSLTWTRDGFVASFSAEGRVKTDIRL